MSTGGSDRDRRAEARVGRVLCGKWRLDWVLGIGGLTTVYAATRLVGERVAIRVLHADWAVDDPLRARFLRDTPVTARIVGHPGAVVISDADVSEDGEAFLVMELLDGEEVGARCNRAGGRLAAGEVLWIADQVLDVLAAAHEKMIIHGDIKPDNLFLTTQGELKVLDFGIEHLHGFSDDEGRHTPIALGNPSFMPPEQARGQWELIDARTDIWAVGATMFTLLTGSMVHGGLTLMETVFALATKPARAVRSVAPEVPSAVAAVVDKALALEPAKRWADAREMRAAVRAAGAAR